MKRYQCLVLALFMMLIQFLYILDPNTICRRLQVGIFNDKTEFEENIIKGKLLPEDIWRKACLDMKLRFLTIGGTVAYAQHLNRSQTYSHITCNGDRIVGPNLKPDNVAPCLKEMIADNVYDVIVLDMYKESNENLLNLTRRLINRFPNATILNMRQFFPGDVGFKHRNGWVSVQSWLKYYGHTSLTKEALDLFKNSSKPWTMKISNGASSFSEQNVKENFIWSFYKDDNDAYSQAGEYWKKALLRRAWLFDDWYRPNVHGHMDIARGILDLSIYQDLEDRNNTNQWDRDSCDY